MKKPKPKPKTKPKSTYSRRKFIGNCVAGTSILNMAPLITFPGNRLFEFPNPQDPIKNKVYHPLDPKFKDDPQQPTDPRISTSFSNHTLTTTINFPGFFSFEKSLSVKDSISPLGRNKVFHYISMENMGWMNNNGKPELPFLALLFHIPKFLTFKLEDISPELPVSNDTKEFHEIPGLLVYPTQAELFDNIGSKKSYRKSADYDESVYGLNQKSPEFVVEQGDSFDFGYSRLILVKIRPLLYNPRYENPDTGEIGPMIFGHSHIQFRFNFVAESRIIDEYKLETPYLPQELDSLPRHERIIDPWYSLSSVNEILPGFTGNAVSNYKQFGPDLLIIYPKDYYFSRNIVPGPEHDPVTDLLEHKRKHGFPFAKSISFSQLENTINIIRNTRNIDSDIELIPWPRLRHVIIFADVDEIPSSDLTRVLGVNHSQDDFFYSRFRPKPNASSGHVEKKIHSDFYNGTLINRTLQNDIVLSDICIGRIPAKSTFEANLVVQNIIEYDNLKENIRNNVTLVSYFQDIGTGSRGLDREASTDYLQTMEIIREKLNFGANIKTIYQTQIKPSPDQKLKYRDGTDVDESLEFLSTEDSKDRILQTFKRGGGLVVHRDHGFMDGWSRPNFKIPDLWKLETITTHGNSNKKPSIVFNVNCLSGHFMGEESDKLPQLFNKCFSEVLLLGVELPDGTKLNLKCPAVIAAGDESPTFHNDWLIKAIFDGIFGGVISRKPREVENPSKVRLGNALNLAKMLLFTSMEETGLSMYENEIYHLLGDPTLLV